MKFPTFLKKKRVLAGLVFLPFEGFLLQLFHVGFFSIAVAVIVMGIPGCELLLYFRVFPGSVRM